MKKFFVVNCIIFLSHIGIAQWVQTSGPPGGGRVISLFINGENLIASTADNGIFISTDIDASWEQSNAELSYFGPRLFLGAGQYILAATYGGILRSQDNGYTWSEANIGMSSNRSVTALALIGTTLIAGTSLGSYFISENFGDTWMGVSLAQPIPNCFLVFNSELYAGTSGQGIVKSTDNGITWTEVSDQITNLNIQSLAFIDSSLFAGTSDHGVIKSTDDGATWKPVNAGLNDITINALIVSGSTLFAVASNGLYRSLNKAASWTSINNGLPGTPAVISLAANELNLYAGLDGGGVFYSENNGNSWKKAIGLPCTKVCSMAVQDSSIFAGTFGSGLFSTTDNGTTWKRSGIAIPEWVRINVLAVNGTDIYAGTSQVTYISNNNGNSWTESYLSGISSFAFSGATIYAGASSGIIGVYKSSDHGGNWENISNGLPYRPVNAIAILGTTLFAGTDGNGIYRSSDNGISWIPVNSGLTNQLVTSLVVNGTTIFAGTYGGVYLSTNNGTLWTQVSYGEIHSLAYYGSTIFAGTWNGVNISTDDGNSWTSVNEGINHAVNSFAFSGTKVFAGTDGSGVFINNNLVTGIDEVIPNTHDIFLYPNPATNLISLETADFAPGSFLCIYNINGQELLRMEISDVLTTIDISSLSSGWFVVCYSNGRIVHTGKFIKD